HGPARAAHRPRRAGQPRADRPARPLDGRRTRLREPLGQLLLRRPDADRAGPAHGGRRRGRVPRARLRPLGGMTAYVLLEDGTRFDGEACGAPGAVTGEVVFNTAMSGYQESVTDPSYRRQ